MILSSFPFLHAYDVGRTAFIPFLQSVDTPLEWLQETQGFQEDLKRTEAHGAMEGANPDVLSDSARIRTPSAGNPWVKHPFFRDPIHGAGI